MLSHAHQLTLRNTLQRCLHVVCSRLGGREPLLKLCIFGDQCSDARVSYSRSFGHSDSRLGERSGRAGQVVCVEGEKVCSESTQ
jgi:hypothetical protein